jgi:YD repeat-containing protein
MMSKMIVARILALAVLVAPSCLAAQETTTYTYDAKGRVVGVSRSGGPSAAAATTYSYDKADNRTNVTVTSSPNGGGQDGGSGATAGNKVVVVLPLNGFTVLVFNK